MSASLLVPVAIVAFTVAAMEALATLVHKYVMHGWGWGWHRSHHEPHDGLLEKNDLYAVAFAAVSVLLFSSLAASWPALWWVGVGTLVYGLLYTILHDGLVHRRLPFFGTPRSGYLKRLVQAHRLHHAVREREGAVSFGFLYAPPVRRLRRALREAPAGGEAADSQARIGLALAALLGGAWLVLHIYSIFFLRLEGWGLVPAPFLVAAICWLDVGLFIVAHDCMHGSLAPRRPRVNRWVGRIALAAYAGFSFDRLLPKHFAHHRHSGTEGDPDFSAAHPRAFWPWFLGFVRGYFGLRELAVLSAFTALYVLLLGAPYPNLLLFWGAPAILSALQLFLFGTYLPHRAADEPFADRHRARSNDLGWLASLLTCFHFGYHHEHHLAPHVPWWRLPRERGRMRALSAPPPRPDRHPA